MSSEQLNEYLATSSYLGGDTCATLEDYKQCAKFTAGSIDSAKLPHLFRWHEHVSHLAAKYPKCDGRGEPIPQGKAPALSGAKASEASAAAPSKAEKAEKAEKAASPKAEAKKEGASPKAEAKKEGKKDKGGKKDDKKDAAPAAPEDPEKARKDLLKKVIKEGGKRGVEIEGAADMGGLQFFCTAVEFPDGDLDLVVESMKAMNAKSDPTEEERKGGSGHIGKMIFSAGVDRLAVCAYVPEAKQSELSCVEWLKDTIGLFSGTMHSEAKDLCVGFVAADSDKGVFPLKIREPMILQANNFLRKKGLFPEDNSDDDDFVFGDDDFPS